MAQLSYVQTFQINNSTLLSNSIIQARNEDYIIAGRLLDKTEDSSAFAIRVTPGGLVKWKKVYSSAFGEYFNAITQIKNGNFVATGTFNYSTDANDKYIWIIMLDACGNKIWETFCGSQNTQNIGYDIVATSDGGFIVTSIIRDIITDKVTTWVLKFDSVGCLEWSRIIGGYLAYSIIQTKDGGYALSGAKKIPDSLFSYPFVARLNLDGCILWKRVYTDLKIFSLLDTDIVENMNGHFAVVAKSVLFEIDDCGSIVLSRQDNRFNLNTVIQTCEGEYAVGGILIVGFTEHAYVAVVDPISKLIRWDNTEISFNSGVSQIIINQNGYVTGTGFIPKCDEMFIPFLAIYTADSNALRK